MATNPQALINPDYHATVVRAAISLNQAAAQQTQDLLRQVLEALKLSLMTAIQQGFLAVLLMSGLMVLGTFLFKDFSLVDEASLETETALEEEKDVSTLPV